MALRWYYRLEHEELDDFRYTGLANVVENHLFLGTVPQTYTDYVIGSFTQYRY